jgi:hypothetical protein
LYSCTMSAKQGDYSICSTVALQLQVDSVSVITLDSTSGQPLGETDVEVPTIWVVVLTVNS